MGLERGVPIRDPLLPTQLPPLPTIITCLADTKVDVVIANMPRPLRPIRTVIIHSGNKRRTSHDSNRRDEQADTDDPLVQP